MINQRRPLVALVLVSVIAFGVAGCGSTAPAAGTNSASSENGNRTGTQAKKGVVFAACMRSHGVSDFPDPSAGNLTLDGIVNGSSLDPNSPAFTHALAACKGLEPAGFTGAKRSPQQMSAALRFAQCIRENGVPDFPDPVNGQPLVDTNRIPSANQPGGMSTLNAAMHKCSSLGAQAIGSQQ